MSTVAEIESAIQQLPIEQVREVAAWLDEYQAAINASATVFSMLDAEEGEGDQWHGTK
jgi:hypothetical protein